MTIIHTSDWHLGAKLHEQDRAEDQAAFLSDLRALMQSHGAEVLLISGDVFDLRQPASSAQALYYDFLAAMDECPTCKKVIVTAGNHDSASLLAASGLALKRIGVEVVSRASEDVSKEIIVLRGSEGKPELVVAAVPFMNDGELYNFARAAGVEAETTKEKLAAGFKAHYASAIAAARQIAKGAPVVVTGHCVVSGAMVSDKPSERGRETGGLESYQGDAFDGADYVALGHLHIPQFVKGFSNVAYSGSPLPMSFAESGKIKQVNLISFHGEPGAWNADVKALDLPSYTSLEILEGSTDAVRDALLELKASNPEKIYVSVRVTEGNGELAPFWSEIDSIAQNTGIRILVKENARPRAAVGSGIAAASEKTLSVMTPLEVATLRINEESDLTEEERAEYVAMVREAIGGIA